MQRGKHSKFTVAQAKTTLINSVIDCFGVYTYRDHRKKKFQKEYHDFVLRYVRKSLLLEANPN